MGKLQTQCLTDVIISFVGHLVKGDLSSETVRLLRGLIEDFAYNNIGSNNYDHN
jgi:hypothetical protein